MASDLIDVTATTTLAEGLDIELSKLTDIFSTRDDRNLLPFMKRMTMASLNLRYCKL